MDRRELILARLAVIAAGVEGVTFSARNRDELSDRQRPAIIILDADEVADAGGAGQGRKPQAPSVVSMTPEIYILLSDKPADVGGSLNTLRARLLKAVLADATLANLTGPNGAIRYEGCATGLSRGRSMEGEMGVSIAFLYPLNPNEL
jgi:hypothetical protein